MAVRHPMRITAVSLALAVGLTGAAQAEPFNIFSASKASEATSGAPVLEQVRDGRGGRHYGHRRGFNPGAAFAIGTLGVIAGAAAASNYNRSYCDPYYEYCGPRRVYRDYGPGYYAPPPRRYYYYD